ncbi:LysR family transcriptional regulator [Rouxiella sp. T17]|uniref:LysR family transcriptional regulator n=1 Tax=Rouxiella sp. T17 TaxID=3085684 RepID=UPI002FC9E431
MDTQLLRAFVTVAETSNISQSAKILSLSQPTLTRQLQRLEDQLGAPLFIRGRNGSELTLFGFKMLDEAKYTLAQCDRLERSAKQLLHGKKDQLRIGFGYWAINRVLKAAALFRQQWPNVSLELRDISSSGQLTGLNEGELDVGFMRIRSCEGLEQQVLQQDQLLLIFRGRIPEDVKSLIRSPLVLMGNEAAPDFYLQVMHYYQQKEIEPQIRQITNEFHSALAWTAIDNVVTFLPESMRMLMPPSAELNAVRAGSDTWPLGIMWRNQPHRKALKDFLLAVELTK